jgi:hypothetical protein
VLDPNAMCEGDLKVMRAARRPGSLDGLTLGLLWNGKRGGDVALRVAGERIAQRYDNVKVIRYDGSMPFDKSLLAKAREECDIFVGSTAD